MRAILLAPLLLIGCSNTSDDSGVTGDEAVQLNAAADLLDINATVPDTPAPQIPD